MSKTVVRYVNIYSNSEGYVTGERTTYESMADALANVYDSSYVGTFPIEIKEDEGK